MSTMNSREWDLMLMKSKIAKGNNQEMVDMIVSQMEVVRIKNNYSKRQFEKLLGVPTSYYSKITKHKRHCLNATTMLLFCRLFCIDLSEMAGRSYLDSHDAIIRESAILLSGLSNETLDSVYKVIAESNEPKTKISRAALIFEGLKENPVKPIDFFLRDLSEADIERLSKDIPED